jgi:hypothetical protein
LDHSLSVLIKGGREDAFHDAEPISWKKERPRR